MTHQNLHWDTDCVTCKYNTASVCFDNHTCLGCDMHNGLDVEPRCKCFEKCDNDEAECPYYKEA